MTDKFQTFSRPGDISAILSYLARGAAFTLVYVGLDYLTYVKPYHGLGITPWNPSVGLSLAYAFLSGFRGAPFILAAPGFADWAVRSFALGWLAELLISLFIGATYLAAGLALRRSRDFDPRFRTVQASVIFIIMACVAAALAAFCHANILTLFDILPSTETWRVFWRAFVGDLIGLLTFCPLILIVSAHTRWPMPTVWSFLQALALIGALSIVFGYQDATAFQLFYLLFLPALWVALEHGPPGAVVALLFVQIGLIIGADIRFGPNPGLGALQVLMIALAMTSIIVSSLVAEREDAAVRLRDLEAGLNRALRLRSTGEVAATIAHELNQPLTALNTYAAIARKAFDKNDLVLASNVIQKLQSECTRAHSVLSSVRNLLRQGVIKKKKIEVGDIFNDLEELLQADLKKREIVLKFMAVPSRFVIEADKVQVQQALYNLIMNSAQAISGAARKGKINVLASFGEHHDCLLQVVDNGSGFPPGYDVCNPLPFISTKKEGSGIGILVARSIAEAHGGSLSIESTAWGAKVVIRLPQRREPS